MEKTNIKPLFLEIKMHTAEAIKEASSFTGISVRMLHKYLANAETIPSGKTLLRLAQYFTHKLGRTVTIDDLFVEQNIVNALEELSITAFRASKITKQKIKS